MPGYGPLAYCGLAGFYPLVIEVKTSNNMDHPLCRNIREGTWMMDFLVDRLAPHTSLGPFHGWVRGAFELVKGLPSYLHPKHFAEIIELAYNQLTARAVALMRLEGSSKLAQSLALGSVQLVGSVRSTGLHPSSTEPCMSAGLPHFTTHHMRVWGRDVFLAFKGMFLLPGRFEEAKQHLVAFAGCLYHGLIPNLLDSGRRPRFNSRDATWFFLQALQDYYRMAPDGPLIMDVAVPMRFNGDVYSDFDDPEIYTKACRLREIVDRILQQHLAGIKFVEWNAGKSLDHAMQPDGFTVEARINLSTGLVSGGNAWNCGTWMDKMGESELAKNVGVPATPRDGAAIELSALFASCCRWLLEIDGSTSYRLHDGQVVRLDRLYEALKSSFESHFYVPEDAGLDASFHISAQVLVGRRGIYRDTFGASSAACDFQLRPNLLTAMLAAPELFSPARAKGALQLVETHLLGPLGMRTLDPADPSYRPDYHQAESADYLTSKGFNYHQGPEWVWCLGHYLLAWMHFNRASMSGPEIRAYVMGVLRPHVRHLEGLPPFLGLPELTNREGSRCGDSCESQAWSMATILEVVLQVESL